MILLSKTNGLIIYLLPNELHCTFTENLLWKSVTLVLKDFCDNMYVNFVNYLYCPG